MEIFEELGRRLGYEEYFPRYRNGIDYIRMLIGMNTDVDAAISPRGPALVSEEWAPAIPYKDGKFNTPSGKFEFYSSIMEERGKKHRHVGRQHNIDQGIVISHHGEGINAPSTLVVNRAL